MWTWKTFLPMLTAVSASLAIIRAVGELLRRRREKEVRRDLQRYLYRLRRVSGRVTPVAVGLCRKIGSPASDRALLSQKVRGDRIYLETQIDECDEVVAYLRSVDANGSLDRLRGDVEAIATVIRRAAEIYLQGVADLLRNGSTTPRGMILVPTERAGELAELKREGRSLFRTCGHRFGLDRHAPDPVPVLWPVTAADLRSLPSEDVLWGCEPRPISWGRAQPSS